MLCRHCKFFHPDLKELLKHYRLHHWHHVDGLLRCVFIDCVCTFKTKSALKSHLSRSHPQSQPKRIGECVTIKCDICEFNEVCDEKTFFNHLASHLKDKITVACPFINCNYKANISGTFRSHRSRSHKNQSVKDFKSSVFLANSNQPTEHSEEEVLSEGQAEVDYNIEPTTESDSIDFYSLQEHKVAALLLCMQTNLHVSGNAIQVILENLNDVLSLSSSHTVKGIEEILLKNNCAVDQTVIAEVTDFVQNSNPFLVTTEKGALATQYKRAAYFKKNFPLVEPTEYFFRRPNKKFYSYVPILKVLNILLCRPDVLEKTLNTTEETPGVYNSFRDGQYYKVNNPSQELHLSIGLYLDDLETSDPLGTSRKKNKITAVYWVILNWPPQFRSNLNAIQLALLGRSDDVKEFGFETFFCRLLSDLKVLETEGIFVEQLGEYIKGSVFVVSADNLGAHGLAGFQENFLVDRFCRFCLASKSEFQQKAASLFELRTPELHDAFLQQLKADETLTNVNGVKRGCVLRDELSTFHPVTGFPPDILHDFFEGIVPMEIALCFHKLISDRIVTFDQLNNIIATFPYAHSDKVNKPQKIPKAFLTQKKGSIGGNGHENWTLLRLLPLMIGCLVPKEEKAWLSLLLLKDIVELVTSSKFSEGLLSCLESKISDHRQLFKEAFPNVKLKPKHHFVEHYPHLIRCFGPLVDLWTFRFESKHSFFKRIVRDCHNTKSLLQTLAKRHQLMQAYVIDSPSFFKPELQVSQLKTVRTSLLEPNQRVSIERRYGHRNTVSLSTNVCVHGTSYSKGMIVSIGSCSGIPDFCKILHVLITDGEMSLILEKLTSLYIEHLHAFEVVEVTNAEVYVNLLPELNDYYPLTAYRIGGKLLVSLKRAILC